MIYILRLLFKIYYKMSKKPAPTNVSFKELIFTEEEKNAIENKDKARIE